MIRLRLQCRHRWRDVRSPVRPKAGLTHKPTTLCRTVKVEETVIEDGLAWADVTSISSRAGPPGSISWIELVASLSHPVRRNRKRCCTAPALASAMGRSAVHRVFDGQWPRRTNILIRNGFCAQSQISPKREEFEHRIFGNRRKPFQNNALRNWVPNGTSEQSTEKTVAERQISADFGGVAQSTTHARIVRYQGVIGADHCSRRSDEVVRGGGGRGTGVEHSLAWNQ